MSDQPPSYPAVPPGYPAPWGPPGLPGYPGGSPWAPPPKPASPTLGVVALVLAILPLCLTWIAAVVLAIVVLAGPRDGQKRGRGLAWAALAIVVAGIVAIIVAIVVVAATIPADRDESGAVVSGGEIFPESVRIGDCIDEDLSGPYEADVSVSVVPCDEPHPGEVFHLVSLDTGPYPGRAEIARIAEVECPAAFESFVGIPLEASSLSVTYLYPSRSNWGYDEKIRCVVVPPDEVTGTLEGSGL